MNIETDLAYALKVKECPQILFLRGNRIVYREKGEIAGLSLYILCISGTYSICLVGSKTSFSLSRLFSHNDTVLLMPLQNSELRMSWFR